MSKCASGKKLTFLWLEWLDFLIADFSHILTVGDCSPCCALGVAGCSPAFRLNDTVKILCDDVAQFHFNFCSSERTSVRFCFDAFGFRAIVDNALDAGFCQVFVVRYPTENMFCIVVFEIDVCAAHKVGGQTGGAFLRAQLIDDLRCLALFRSTHDYFGGRKIACAGRDFVANNDVCSACNSVHGVGLLLIDRCARASCLAAFLGCIAAIIKPRCISILRGARSGEFKMSETAQAKFKFPSPPAIAASRYDCVSNTCRVVYLCLIRILLSSGRWARNATLYQHAQTCRVDAAISVNRLYSVKTNAISCLQSILAKFTLTGSRFSLPHALTAESIFETPRRERVSA